jgi:hypothetical protein
MAILGYREGGRSAQSLSLFSQAALFVYIMHVWWQYHIGKFKWDRFGEVAVPYPTFVDLKSIYGHWSAAHVSQYKEQSLLRKDLAVMATRVWVLSFLVDRAQQGFFTLNGTLVFQVGPEKHQWPPGGRSSPAKMAMSILSFGQKDFNQPSKALLRFVYDNWRGVVDFAFHLPTASRGMMRTTNPYDIPAPYATQPPFHPPAPPPTHLHAPPLFSSHVLPRNHACLPAVRAGSSK